MAEARDVKSWVLDPSQLPRVVKNEEAKHSSRQSETRAYLRAYWDRPVPYPGNPDRSYRELAVFDEIKAQFGGNLTAEVVDAAVSILCREYSPKVEPKGDEFSTEQGCKEATRLIEGVMDNSNFVSIAKQAIRDGATADLGPVKGVVVDDEIRFERVNPLDFWWVENGTDKPRTVGETTGIDRYELIDRLPKYKAKILKAPRFEQKTVVGVDLPGFNRGSDCVKYTEVYATTLGKQRGKHAIMVGDELLEVEDWDHDLTPYFRFVWGSDFRGYAGRQLARIVARYDAANRKLLRKIYAGLDGAVPQLLEHEDSDTDGPSDMAFARWKWSGPQEPKVIIPPAVSPDVIARLEWNYARAYAEGGVNQNMATGAAPAQYTSGAAQREFVDIANTRLLDAQQQTLNLWSDGGRVVVMLANQAKKTYVRLKGMNRYVSVSFPDLPRDKFKVTFGVASGLSLTPAGRKQDLSDLQQLMPSVIDEAEVARSLNLPDVQERADEMNAPRDLVRRQIEMILDAPDDAPFPMPSAMMDLNAAIRLGKTKWQLCQVRGNVPPARVEKLRRWIKACEARVAIPKPAAPGPMPGAPAPGPGPGPAIGAPGPTPGVPAPQPAAQAVA